MRAESGVEAQWREGEGGWAMEGEKNEEEPEAKAEAEREPRREFRCAGGMRSLLTIVAM